MKRIIITIGLLFIFQAVVAGSIINYSSTTNIKSSNLSNINWEKHIIDEAFDYAFDIAQASDCSPAVITAIMVLTNTIAKQIIENEENQEVLVSSDDTVIA